MAKADTIEYLRDENRRLRAALELERRRAAERIVIGAGRGNASPTESENSREGFDAKLAAVIDERIAIALGTEPSLPKDAREAYAARYVARVRGYFLVPEFAAVIGRHNQFVSDRCNDGRIATLRGGKPYRIPLNEEVTWNKLPH